MRESVFIRQNLSKWKEYENLIDSASVQSPDVLADMYTDLTADLAFAQTHYPNSKATEYINGLTLSLHNEIYKGRREKWSHVRDFWVRDIPLAVYNARKEMRASLIVFLTFVAIGAISTVIDTDFPRLILGDGYVDMTIDNIRAGKPTDVYNSGNESLMFLGITLNNLKVGLTIFVMGIFTSLGTGLVLASNGIMVGAFTTFFAQYGVFGASTMAIMQHGTLELSTIVIEGAAGIVMGNAWLFPGTYSRIESFKRGAKRGFYIAVSAMPVTVMAGFIEGFITRHVEAPLWLRSAVILFSALFIIYYYIVFPVVVHRKSIILKPNEEEGTLA